MVSANQTQSLVANIKTMLKDAKKELLKAKALGIPWALEPEKELEEQPAEQVVTKKKAKVAKKPKVKIQQVGMFE